MRSAYRAYLPPTPNELKSMWKESLLSFDANVLLNVYRYPDDPREKLLKAMEKLSGRMRLPHQFGLEFARNRAKVIAEEAIKCQKAAEKIAELKDLFTEPRGNPPPSRLRKNGRSSLDYVVG